MTCREKDGESQPRSQSSSAISNMTSAVKFVGRIPQPSSPHSDSANMPGDENGRINILVMLRPSCHVHPGRHKTQVTSAGHYSIDKQLR